jgi:structural maintenance of chromosome 1
MAFPAIVRFSLFFFLTVVLKKRTDLFLPISISLSGSSEYKINGKTVSYKRYNDQLETFNILVKAKNFLVFQGDVEAVASQSPKDLAKLIDQISGSLDLKEEYDKASAALQKATDASLQQHSRRKGVNSEVKQYQLMKTEAERWQQLQTEKTDAIVHHLVWKLFHIEEGIKASEEKIEERNEDLKRLREENEKFEEEVRAKKKEVNKATKEVGKQERAVKTKEKELEEAVRLAFPFPSPLSLLTLLLHSVPNSSRSTPAASTPSRSSRKPILKPRSSKPIST